MALNTFMCVPILLAHADVVIEWNQRAGKIVVGANIGPLPADRALAMTQAAVYETTNAITRRYPASDLKLDAAPGASVILARRVDDGAVAEEAYRPYANPGVYVLTVIPEMPQWARRKPWLMENPAQLRPAHLRRSWRVSCGLAIIMK